MNISNIRVHKSMISVHFVILCPSSPFSICAFLRLVRKKHYYISVRYVSWLNFFLPNLCLLEFLMPQRNMHFPLFLLLLNWVTSVLVHFMLNFFFAEPLYS